MACDFESRKGDRPANRPFWVKVEKLKSLTATTMPRFLTGDELGNIKSLRHHESNSELKTIHDGSSTGKLKGIQALSMASASDGSKLVRIHVKPLCQDTQSCVQGKVAAGHTDGSASTFILKDDDRLELLHEWKETRLKPDQTFVGLSASER